MFFTLAILFIAFCYYYLRQINNYWKKRNVPGPEPTLLIGNIGRSLIMKQSIGELFTDIYNKYKSVPFVGVFQATKPALLLRDPELIKDITVKSFSHFHDNNFDVDKDLDPLMGRNPFFLKGEEWKHSRSQLTPTFTSGKMKSLFPLLNESSSQLVKYIEKESTTNKGALLEAKELCSRFTINNVATCAFGLDAKSYEDEKSKFRDLAQKFLTPSSLAQIKFFILMLFPSLSQFIKIKFTPSDVEEEMKKMIEETVRYREENNIIRNDFLHLINELRKSSTDNSFTMLDVAAQATGFILDGYETSSTVMSFLLFELAANPEVQSKARADVIETIKKNNGVFDYQSLQDMAYLEATFCELLRLHSPIFLMFKMCTENYAFTPSNDDKSFVIEKGTGIIIPLHGIHTDPKYYPNPEKFLPERFLGENKEKNPKYTFMPFGMGPRACLGQRFAALQIKIGLVNILQNFEITVNEKTKYPFVYDPVNFVKTPIGGIWLNFKKI